MDINWADVGRQVLGKGAPALGKALGGPLGEQAGSILADILGVPADPEAVSAELDNPLQDPKVLSAETERAADWAAILSASQAFQLEMAKLDKGDGFFSYGWRPALSWCLLVLWTWALMFLPLLNAAFHAAIPAPPHDTLLGFTTVWLTIYSGGNTLLRTLGKK